MNCWWLQLWHQGELKVTPDWCHSPFKFVGFFYLAMLASNSLLDLSISTLSCTVRGKSQLQSSHGRSWLTFQSKDMASHSQPYGLYDLLQDLFNFRPGDSVFCCVLYCRGLGYGGWGYGMLPGKWTVGCYLGLSSCDNITTSIQSTYHHFLQRRVSRHQWHLSVLSSPTATCDPADVSMSNFSHPTLTQIWET